MREVQQSRKVMEQKMNMTLEEVTALLDTISTKLKTDGTFTMIHNNEEIKVTPADIVKAEVKYKEELKKYTFELELTWPKGQPINKIEIK